MRYLHDMIATLESGRADNNPPKKESLKFQIFCRACRILKTHDLLHDYRIDLIKRCKTIAPEYFSPLILDIYTQCGSLQKEFSSREQQIIRGYSQANI